MRAPMKKILLLPALVAYASVAVAQTPKLGHIDRAAMVNSLPAHDSAEAIMRGFVERLQGRLEAMKAEFDARLAKYEADRGTMTATMREVEERELTEMRDRLVAADERAEEDAEKQQQELLAPLVKKVDEAIKAVADEKGFTYIFDTNVGLLLYTDEGEDITPLVRTKLGLK
jgi:outer membrane protein